MKKLILLIAIFFALLIAVFYALDPKPVIEQKIAKQNFDKNLS